MPRDLSRILTGTQRTPTGNAQLGYGLAFVAGAANAGAFLAVHQYTSHMTGILSSFADAFALRQWSAAAAALGAIVSFLGGAASSTVLVLYARRHRLRSAFALPLLFEAMLLLIFGMIGARLAVIQGSFVPVTVILLCYMMGLQNALMSKMSNAEIRTTHVTGLITDLGIECGKWIAASGAFSEMNGASGANRERMLILMRLILSFGVGGMLGALGFQRVGYVATIPLAALLLLFAFAPLLDDLLAAQSSSRP